MKQLALSWKLLLNVHSDSIVWPPPITRDGEFTWCILYQIRLATGSTFPLVSVEWYNLQRAGGWGGYERSISSIQKHEKCLPHVTVPAKPEICINWIEKFCMACSEHPVVILRHRRPCCLSGAYQSSVVCLIQLSVGANPQGVFPLISHGKCCLSWN